MIPRKWAEAIADSQDIGGLTKESFITNLSNGTYMDIDPISDVIRDAVNNASGDSEGQKLEDMMSSLEYAENMIARAKRAITNLYRNETTTT